jgi:hypothetical protein
MDFDDNKVLKLQLVLLISVLVCMIMCGYFCTTILDFCIIQSYVMIVSFIHDDAIF